MEERKQAKIKTIENLSFQLFPMLKQKLAEAFREDTGLAVRCNRTQNMVLFLIKEGQAVTLTELGRFLDLQKGSLTPIIDSLERYGLVRRNADPEDRRKALLSLTEDGERYIGEMRRLYEAAMFRLFSVLPEEEIDELIDCLTRVVQIMEKL